MIDTYEPLARDDWTQFWRELERAYLHVCDELALDPRTADPQRISEGIDQLAQEGVTR